MSHNRLVGIIYYIVTKVFSFHKSVEMKKKKNFHYSNHESMIHIKPLAPYNLNIVGLFHNRIDGRRV